MTMRRTISLTLPSRVIGTTSGSPGRALALTGIGAGAGATGSGRLRRDSVGSTTSERWKNPDSLPVLAGPVGFSRWNVRAGGGAAALRSARSAAGCWVPPNSPRVVVNGLWLGAAGGAGAAGASGRMVGGGATDGVAATGD